MWKITDVEDVDTITNVVPTDKQSELAAINGPQTNQKENSAKTPKILHAQSARLGKNVKQRSFVLMMLCLLQFVQFYLILDNLWLKSFHKTALTFDNKYLKLALLTVETDVQSLLKVQGLTVISADVIKFIVNSRNRIKQNP